MIRPVDASERAVLVFAIALVGAASTLGAQCTPGGPANPAAQRNALTGIVMDSAHVVIEGAEVFVEKPARRARTDVNGRFVIDKLDPGTYTVSARRIGYEVAQQDYIVTDSGGVARFCLIPDVSHLQPMITSSKRIGIGGVIGDSTYQPLAGAEVRVLGQDRAVSDSAGGFFIPVRPGTYAVTVTKPGYGRQLVSVTVPKDSGRQIAVWLGSPPRNPNRMAAAYDEMRIRIDTANSNRSALWSAEKLSTVSVNFRFAAQTAIKTKLPDECDAIIDGGPWRLPIDAIAKEDVATMEIYMGKAARGGATSIDSRGTGAQRERTGEYWGCLPFVIFVWLK